MRPGEFRSCQIGGLKPKVEVYALMTARDGLAGVCQRTDISVPPRVKEAAEGLFAVCGRQSSFTLQ